MPFWSCKKSLGKDRQVTSRSDPGSWACLAYCEVYEGLSGRAALPSCAQADFGELQMPAQSRKSRIHRFSLTFIEVLGCSFPRPGKPWNSHWPGITGFFRGM